MRRCGRCLAALGIAALGAAGFTGNPHPHGDCVVADDCEIGEDRRVGEGISICVVLNGKKVCPG